MVELVMKGQVIRIHGNKADESENSNKYNDNDENT